MERTMASDRNLYDHMLDTSTSVAVLRAFGRSRRSISGSSGRSSHTGTAGSNRRASNEEEREATSASATIGGVLSLVKQALSGPTPAARALAAEEEGEGPDLDYNLFDEGGTVRVFRQKFTLEDAIGSRACSLEANMRVPNGIPFGSSLSRKFTLLPS
jgi:hypothetical protein